MSVNKVNPDGSLSRIAGRGTVEFGASTVRSGSYVGTTQIDPDGSAVQGITFTDPMPDGDYLVNLDSMSHDMIFTVQGKSKNGFTVVGYNEHGNSQIMKFNYTAFKLHTVEGLEELENSVGELQRMRRTTQINANGHIDINLPTYNGVALITGFATAVGPFYGILTNTHGANFSFINFADGKFSGTVETYTNERGVKFDKIDSTHIRITAPNAAVTLHWTHLGDIPTETP